MNEKNVYIVVKEAARLKRKNPKLTYKKAMAKAKEELGYEKMEKMEKTY